LAQSPIEEITVDEINCRGDKIMVHFDYATELQLSQLIHASGLPENTPPANAFRILAHTPLVGAATLKLIFGLLTATELDPRLRELVILRSVHRCDAQYAWVQHVAIARGLGVNEEQIAAPERGETRPALFNEWERTAFTLADELIDTCRVTDHTFSAAQSLFSSREIVELLVLIGYFRMISGLMTGAGVDLESPFGARILDSLAAAGSHAKC
jgi:4-carboxymuconolactone decarboxylase